MTPPTAQEQAEKALERLGNIINDAPYRLEERDGAWQAFLQNKEDILAALRAQGAPQPFEQTVDDERRLEAIAKAMPEFQRTNDTEMTFRERQLGRAILKALRSSPSAVPTSASVEQAIPSDYFKRKPGEPCSHPIAVDHRCFSCGEDVTPYRQQRKRFGTVARAAKQAWLDTSTASDPHDEYEAMAQAVAEVVRAESSARLAELEGENQRLKAERTDEYDNNLDAALGWAVGEVGMDGPTARKVIKALRERRQLIRRCLDPCIDLIKQYQHRAEQAESALASTQQELARVQAALADCDEDRRMAKAALAPEPPQGAQAHAVSVEQATENFNVALDLMRTAVRIPEDYDLQECLDGVEYHHRQLIAALRAAHAPLSEGK